MNDLVDFIFDVIKMIFLIFIWAIILYCIGYVVVWTFTLGRYPKGPLSRRQKHLISGTGFLFLVVIWFSIAGYNNFIRTT